MHRGAPKARPARYTWSLLALLVVGVAHPAFAREDDPQQAPEDVPAAIPAPSDRPPHLAGELFVEGVVPVATKPLCPSGAACILGGGVGVGGIFEGRWASGTSLGAAYDLWFVDGQAVYSVTVVQSLTALLRHRFLPTNVAHPFVGVGVGGLILGDSFGVDAGGFLVEGHAGVEIEMSRTLALTLAMVWRGFVTTAFRTEADGVRRVEDQGLNLAATFRVGLVVLP